MPAPIRSVKVWINAFIPRDIPGYTRSVPGGPHQGKTMIPGPNRLSDCYLTDQRGFSSDIHAKSRMHSEARIDVTGPAPRMTQWHRCDQTVEVDCEDGDVECTDSGKTGRMAFRMQGNDAGRGVIRLQLDAAASNPCAPTSRLFGDIDITGVVTIDLTARSVEFSGRIDQFPAFEMYAAINDGPGIPLFRLAPPPGHTVMNLPGAADRDVRERVLF